jgi:hypothetical protein
MLVHFSSKLFFLTFNIILKVVFFHHKVQLGKRTFHLDIIHHLQVWFISFSNWTFLIDFYFKHTRLQHFWMLSSFRTNSLGNQLLTAKKYKYFSDDWFFSEIELKLFRWKSGERKAGCLTIWRNNKNECKSKILFKC